MESFSNNDGDGNENGKKTIGLYWQNKRFFVHFLAVVASLRLSRARLMELVNTAQ